MTDKPRRTNPASAQNGRAGGRPIKTAKIRVGDKIGIRIGYGTEMARGSSPRLVRPSRAQSR